MATDSVSSRHLIGFGEAMLRFAPADLTNDGAGKPSYRAPFLRSVGGDELNVMVAASILGGWSTEWVSVLPVGPMGDIITKCAADAGVDVKNTVMDDSPGAELGVFTVLPELKRVAYQRGNSSFARQEAGAFDWASILSAPAPKPVWIHCTGITPMTSETAAANWGASMEAAGKHAAGIVMDLNYRPQLGSLDKLWGYVTPHLSSVHVMVLALSCIQGVGKLCGLPDDITSFPSDTPADDDRWLKLQQAIFKAVGGPAIACCFKIRDPSGEQRRWSTVVDADGTHTTFDTPVFHTPKDECGGGSAWATGVIDALSNPGVSFDRSSGGAVAVRGAEFASVQRHADLLAALCQEEAGDHSTITRSVLDQASDAFAGRPARIRLDAGRLDVPSSTSEGGDVLTPAEAAARVEACHEGLKAATVIAILRAKNVEVALARGEELADLGCKALEVTVDSPDFVNLTRELQRRIGDRVIVGAGTVTNLEELNMAAQAGCRFALSPVHPDDSFVSACHTLGILAVPAAYTPQEIYSCIRKGARCVKLFPAQMWKAKDLKALKAVGEFGHVDIMPSGGISPENVTEWLQAGAAGVGMGSCLVGSDVRVVPSDTEKLAEAKAKWDSEGREAARALFARIADGSIRG